MAKFLDENGLSHLWSKLKALLNKKADTGHVHDAATTSADGFMSSADKTKLDGIATGANKYTHPSYTARTSGLYKVTVNSTGHVSGATAVTKDDITALGIPGQDTNTTYSEATTSSAGLMSSTDKSKLDGITAGANLYTHPSYTARTGVPSANATPAFGGTFSVSQPVSDSSGHITAVNSRTITIPKTEATTSAAGLMSAADKTKLDGIATGANNYTYTHPTYTAMSSGLYKVTVNSTGHVSAATAVTKSDITNLGIPGSDTTYSAMTGATSSAAGSAGLVPAPAAGNQAKYLRGDGTWATPTNTTYSAATTSAAGLMSASDKSKLDGIATGANAYTHPSYTAKSSGLYKVTVDSTGHVSAATEVAKSDITGLGIPAQDTTYSTMGAATSSAAGSAGLVPAPAAGKQASFLRGDGTWVVPTNTTYSAATTSTAGLMSASDKSKLDGIATGATAYVHPTTSGNKHIPSGGSSGQILRWSADGTAAWGADNNTTYSAATTSTAGLMSAADKVKLDGVTSGANAYTHPSYTARTGVPTADATLTHGGTFTVTQPVSDASGHITAMNTRTYTLPTDRFFTTLVPYGTAITADSDLNTVAFMKVGNYYCSSNSTVATLTNCPTTSAFMLTVYSPLSTTIDNESTKTWIYRLRKMMVYTGEEYIQYCYVGSTAGTWTYGEWKKIIKQTDTATTSAAGVMTAAMVTKLNGIATGANAYTHPSYTAKSSGLYKVTVDATGHVSAATAVAKSDITALGIPAQDTTYSEATQSAAGLMSADDKTKLDGFAPVTTAGTGAAYTATIPGATLTAGTRITIVTHTVSTSTTATLNVNSLGAKQIRRYLSSAASSPSAGYTAAWLTSGKAFTLFYDGTYWIVESMTRPVAADLSGTLALTKGGTGATTASAALTNLGAMPIAGGTFTGAAYAGSSVQTPGTSMLRNSKLVSAEETPTVAGEIFWTYG